MQCLAKLSQGSFQVVHFDAQSHNMIMKTIYLLTTSASAW
jgi:hypothetical protein